MKENKFSIAAVIFLSAGSVVMVICLFHPSISNIGLAFSFFLIGVICVCFDAMKTYKEDKLNGTIMRKIK